MDTKFLEQHPQVLTGGCAGTALVRTSIDWVECTFPQTCQVPRPDWMNNEGVECRPMNAYDRAMRYGDGRTEMTHSKRADMGTHVALTGSVIGQYGQRAYELLDIYRTGQGRFSRIDLAVDVFNMPGFTPEMATTLIQAGKCRSRSRAFPLWHDAVGRGYTQYVGAPSSDVRVRIYDKGAERRLDDLQWVRVEAQYRRRRAHTCACAITDGTEERELIRDAVDFPEWPEWEKVFRMPAVHMKTEKQDTNTERWLLQQCAPALARQVALSGTEFLNRFVSAYERELAKIEARTSQ